MFSSIGIVRSNEHWTRFYGLNSFLCLFFPHWICACCVRVCVLSYVTHTIEFHSRIIIFFVFSHFLLYYTVLFAFDELLSVHMKRSTQKLRKPGRNNTHTHKEIFSDEKQTSIRTIFENVAAYVCRRVEHNNRTKRLIIFKNRLYWIKRYKLMIVYNFFSLLFYTLFK